MTLLSMRRSGQSRFCHYDGLGSTVQLSDTTQTVTDTYVYDSWGNQLNAAQPTTNPFRYVGGENYYSDQQSGLMLLGVRSYATLLGRFLSVDPIWFDHLSAHNQYAYVVNDPVQFVDPTGLVNYKDRRFRRDVPNYQEGGIVYHIVEWIGKTDKRRDFVFFAGEKRKDFSCHGYTFDGWNEAGGPFSPYGNEIPKILTDDSWNLVCCGLAQRNDIVIFYKFGSVSHSGKIDKVVHKDLYGGGRFYTMLDEEESKVNSKWGLGGDWFQQDNFTKNVGRWGGPYECYTKRSPAPTGCCEKAPNEK